MASRIVIAGAGASGKQTLARGLVRFEVLTAGGGAMAAAVMGDPLSATPSGATSTAAFTLRTKYYTAPLEVTVVRGDNSKPSDAVRAAIGDSCEAFLLVTDASRGETCASLVEWEDVLDAAAPSTVVVVGSKFDAVADPSDDVYTGVKARCTEWCRDHGYEYVEANCLAPTLSADSRDKVGVARVQECLQNTMWTTMEYLTALRPIASALEDAGIAGGGVGVGEDGGGAEVATASSGASAGAGDRSSAAAPPAVSAAAPAPPTPGNADPDGGSVPAVASRVVVFGSGAAGKQTLASALAQFDAIASGAEPSATPPLVPDAAGATATAAFTLRTKYYTAPLEVTVVRGDNRKPSDAVRDSLKGCQACILVTDASRVETFAHLPEWKDALDAASASTVLVVGSKADAVTAENRAAYDIVKARCTEWCRDRGYEYIEANCLAPTHTADAREKEGVARVQECLQNTMWTTMEYLTALRPSAEALSTSTQPSSGSGSGGSGGGIAGAGAGAGTKPSSDSGSYVAPTPVEVRSNGARGDDAAELHPDDVPAGLPTRSADHEKLVDEAGRRADAILAGLMGGAVSGGGGVGGVGGVGGGGDGGSDGAAAVDDARVEAEANALASMFDEIRAVRERSQGLSDAERRAAASDTAMRLLASMGMGFGSDEEGGSSGDDK